MAASQQASEHHGLADVLDALRELGESKDQVSVADIREQFGERSVGPFLIVPALLELSPIGAVPGFPTLLALIIIAFSVQILFGRRHLWLPGFIERRELPGPKLAKGMSTLRPAAAWVDRFIKHRLPALTRKPFRMLIAVLCIVLCAVVPLLEVVPFASSVPMGAIVMFGLGLIGRDGLLIALGMVVGSATAYMVFLALGQ